ncbi:MAG: hypothetical protein KatS3mg082_2638 [Nitrospiraceae bacterium]|nr:MAG: hypothetical protein KatS3mg082_2638 [Nitrospiraceae bacterium]
MAPPETVAYMDALYPVDEPNLLRTNLLNVVGLVAVVAGAVVFSHIRVGAARMTIRRMGDDPWRVALLFLAIGVPIKYFLELPYVLGLEDFVLPGSVQYFGAFSGLAIVPLAVAAASGRRGARPLFWALVVSEFAVGFVMLAKLHIIKTVLLVVLGHYAVRPSLKRLIVTGLIIAVGYVTILSPFVNFARAMLGRASAQNVAETAEAVQAYGAEGRETLAELLPGVQGWWSRLAYANAQAFAMDQYDQGRPGGTFGMVGYVFVPRFLHGEKPIMTPGIDFTYLIQGTDTSSTGLGFVGEAYWNGGWLLVCMVGLLVGALFAVLGRFSVAAMRSHRWLYVPLVFHAIYLGLRPDDWFVPAYVGGVLQVVLVVLLMRLAFSAFVRRRRERREDGRARLTIGAAMVSAAR